MGKNSGHWGEVQAADYLRKHRYKLVSAGFTCRFGEIDLIVTDRRYVIFVEVKTREAPEPVQAREYVTKQKQGRLRTSAQVWLEQNPTKLQPRFDVVEVYAPQGVDTKDPVIIHIENAF